MTQVTEQDLQLFIDAISENSDYDFEDYSVKSFTRRIEKLLSDNRTDIDGLVKKVTNSSSFLEKTVKNITVNTTELFRDPQIWVKIKNDIIERYSNEPEINIWHAGSSTGQEVFSLLILMHHLGLYDKINSFGTDLNTDVLNVARSGKYKYREIDEYINNFEETFYDCKKKPKLENYIEINNKKSLIKIKPFIFEKPIFTKHDLVTLKNPYEDKKYHMILCRNVLIYFNHDLQNQIFEMFYDNLVPGGTLIIGRHEGILGEIGNKFEKHGTIYIKK